MTFEQKAKLYKDALIINIELAESQLDYEGSLEVLERIAQLSQLALQEGGDFNPVMNSSIYSQVRA